MLLFSSCQSSTNNSVTDEFLDISISKKIVTFDQNSQVVKAANTQSHWIVELDYKGVQSGWCRIADQSGNRATLVCDENLSSDERRVEMTVRSGTQQSKHEIVQLGTPVSDQVNEWLELPAVSAESDELFLSHYMSHQGREQRSYSMLFDKKERIAYWVAYPLHKTHLSGVTRRDKWRNDPKIPKSSQLSATMSDSDYHRGHQLPSADRLCNDEANNQTFYYSNITPQRAALNQGAWLKLERKVRGYVGNCDTLYVVTGAVLKTVGGDESVEYAYDKKGVRAALPNYYFKALLRLKGGEYDAIGFWLDHDETYPNDRDKSGLGEVLSIDALEVLTGHDFFSSLDISVQAAAESRLEPHLWGIGD